MPRPRIIIFILVPCVLQNVLQEPKPSVGASQRSSLRNTHAWPPEVVIVCGQQWIHTLQGERLPVPGESACLCEPDGYDFTPLVVESYGRQCSATHTLLNLLGRLAADLSLIHI